MNHGARPPRLTSAAPVPSRGRNARGPPSPVSHSDAARLLAGQSSGVQVQPECLTVFEEMKIRSAYKVRTDACSAGD